MDLDEEENPAAPPASPRRNACSNRDQPITLELEVYEEESSDDSSSGGLEIVTSDNESSGREHKRKRRDSFQNDDMPDVLNEMEEEIERQLDAKAAKSNLTVANVKNILKHVITNEHVLAMVRHTIKNTEGSAGVTEESEDDFPYEPKLTRAKTKELLKNKTEIPWPITPSKIPPASKCHLLIEDELSEDSSDEEYCPVEPIEEEGEQSDEEKENESFTSDVDTQPPTPTTVSSAKSPSNDFGTHVVWSEDGLFKIPQENIGQRTRSKLSLSDTPLETIEKAFIPPDITTDMYDSECDDEDWKNFLKNFTEPLSNVNDTVDDDEADPEYNVLADEEEETVDKEEEEEELRADKAVKVSRKELNSLVAELFDFDYADMLSSDDEDGKVQQEGIEETEEVARADSEEQEQNVATEVNEVAVAEEDDEVEAVSITNEQRLLLNQQMSKHVQLTLQHFLQTYSHPQLSHMASEFKNFLWSLKYLAAGKQNSAFIAANLEGALDLMQKWENKFSKGSAEGEQIIKFIASEIETANQARKKKQVYRNRFPHQLMEMVSDSEVFLFPLLLPAQPFRCDGFSKPFYLPSEDFLTALGLEQFEPYVKTYLPPPKPYSNAPGFPTVQEALNLISKHMLPGKDPQLLYYHVLKLRNKHGNPIHYYFQHGRAPQTDHYVIPFTQDMVKPPKKQPKELLPTIWRDYIYHRTELKSNACFLLIPL